MEPSNICGSRRRTRRTLAWLMSRAALTLLAVGLPVGSALAGETLAQIKSRAMLRCGVSEGIVGFSAKDGSGRWSGLDADFCRAVAAATLGDGEKVSYVPLRASERFPALQLGNIDLLSRNTTWTLDREAGLRVHFAGVILYDGQGFMVPAAARLKSVSQLKGATICVEKGTTHEQHLANYFAARGVAVKPLVLESMAGMADAFFGGRCKAYTSDVSQLAAVRLRAPAGRALTILPEQISKEPLAPALRRGDDEWLTLVRWVLFALVAAEENRITQKSAGDPKASMTLFADPVISKALGADPMWALRAVQSVGNYGEMFERNLGARSPLKLERGLNRLWNDGGLMYAPPLR